MKAFTAQTRRASALGVALLMSTAIAPTPGQADQVFLDDVIIDGSLCVGVDCINGENFGFDTIRLKENNLRIKAQDTSSSGSFPTVDWQLTFNESTNGGQNKFSVEDIDNGRTPFTLEAGAPSHSLYVDDGGRIGFGTSTPVVEMHVVDGDSPTLRLEQDGSSGFATQTWDLAANEANFFIRDVTNGSQLPFKIIPGADTNSLVVGGNNNVGVGTSTSPAAPLHVRETGNVGVADNHVLIENNNETEGTRNLLQMQNNGGVFLAMTDTSDDGTTWNVQNIDGDFRITAPPGGAGEIELELDVDGNLRINGNFFATDIGNGGTELAVPDYVFAPDYKLRPLSEVAAFIAEHSHLPEVPSAAEIGETGLNMTDMQLRLLKKVEELTLYTLAQEDTIATQAGMMAEMMARMEEMERRLAE